jgi:serine protease AprX
MKKTQSSLAILVIFALLLAALPLAPAASGEAAETVYVRLAGKLPAGLAAVQSLDYGAFQWLEVTPAQLDRLDAAGLSYQVASDPFTLELGGTRFDPAVAGPDLPAGWEGAITGAPDLFLVQVIGPTQAGWLDQLRASGLAVIQYIHPFTYVVWGRPAAVESASAAPFVRWYGPFAPGYRVQPQWRDLPAADVEVSTLLYRGAGPDRAVEALAALGAHLQVRQVLNAIWEAAGFTIPGDQLRAAAHIPGVYTIQLEPTGGGLRGEMSNQVNANHVGEDGYAYPGYPDWLASAGVDGAGVIIANVDGGVQDDHPDLVNRLIPCTGQTCGGGATSAHGTHTAGIMAADGSSGVLDPYGFLRGLGMAPGANLVEQVYSPYFQWPGGMLMLMTDSYNNGASLSGNSWGPSGYPLGYDDDTMQVDIGVRDADPDAPGNQPLSYLLSIMNGNGGYQTQGTPDEAKNIFTIGSTKMQTSGGAQILEIDDLSANTAHGPCLDGRNIPHMVAPGCYVDSTVSGSGHGLMCGTSMASPHVSGAVALFIEYYRALAAVDPSPALIKAAFLPVAHDLAGHLDADGYVLGHPFDYKQGWGRMDTEAVISPTLPVLYLDNPAIFDNTGEDWTQTFSPADPAQPVRLMLVWTDAPGHGLGGPTPAWNNDLDLVVEVGGDSYYGNDFGPDGWSEPGDTADTMNNTEGVFLGPVAPASLTARVVASNINSDGIPNQGDDTDQDFSLVCYNCQAGSGFTLAAEPDSFAVCAPELVTSTITVGEVMTYPHDVTLAALGVPAGVTATLTPDVVAPPGQSLLSLDVSADTADGAYTLIISGTGWVTDTRTVEIDLQVSHATAITGLSSDSPVELGEPLHLEVQATGTEPLTYTWEMSGPGYGSGLETATPVFTYTQPGTYTPTVTVANGCGSDMGALMVDVQCFAPGAAVTLSDPPRVVGTPVFFTATLTGTAPISYTWHFDGPGEGSGLETLTPVFTYTLPGTYTVGLELANPCGTKLIEMQVDILPHEIYLPVLLKG